MFEQLSRLTFADPDPNSTFNGETVSPHIPSQNRLYLTSLFLSTVSQGAAWSSDMTFWYDCEFLDFLHRERRTEFRPFLLLSSLSLSSLDLTYALSLFQTKVTKEPRPSYVVASRYSASFEAVQRLRLILPPSSRRVAVAFRGLRHSRSLRRINP